MSESEANVKVSGRATQGEDHMPNTQSKPQNVVIEDAYGNTITLSNGKITIRSVGVLEITAPMILINGRPVAPNSNPI
jgi:hypothetical protein